MTTESPGKKKEKEGNEEEGKGKDRTGGARALEDDLLGGDHGEAGAGVLVGGIAELGPGSALEGALAIGFSTQIQIKVIKENKG